MKKCITPQLHDPLSLAFHKYWQLLICIRVELGWVYKSTISKRSNKQWLRFKEGRRCPPPPRLGQICQPKWLHHLRVKLTFGEWGDSYCLTKLSKHLCYIHCVWSNRRKHEFLWVLPDSSLKSVIFCIKSWFVIFTFSLQKCMLRSQLPHQFRPAWLCCPWNFVGPRLWVEYL